LLRQARKYKLGVLFAHQRKTPSLRPGHSMEYFWIG